MAEQKIKLGEHETTINTLTEDEAKGIFDSSLDEKLKTIEIPEALDTDAFKASILGEMEGKLSELFEKNKTDEDALIKKLDKTFTDALGKTLKGLGSNGSREKGPGPLSRFLSNS